MQLVVSFDGLGLMGFDAEENTKLNDCFYEKKDWRACKDEVGLLPIRLARPSVLS
jgi:hypothetical protein